MTTLFASMALLPSGWEHDVRLTLEGGSIYGVEIHAQRQPNDEAHGVILPGMANLHSHAFQRGMAGLAELRGPGTDSFWSWRELMYRHALSLDPDQMEAIAAQAYVEMLEGGFTRVGEFHYLHHAPDGHPYADPGEMAGRICAAADQTGIALTLLPVLYAHGGFGPVPAGERQRRFLNSRDAFTALVDRAEVHSSALPGAVVGIAPHSLRAVTPDELAFAAALRPAKPLHLHIAEQVKEVEDCMAWSGQTPVDWLLAHHAVDSRWCLIHATHMTAAETIGVARSGAIAGLCPVTEANLGDGIFNGAAFVDAGGTFGVGSDSNVLIGAAHELRQLEYSQRLAHHARNVLATTGASTGRQMFDHTYLGGAKALGAGPTGLAAGASADVVSLDTKHPALIGRHGDAWLDSWIFAADKAIDCVWVAGRKRVEGGRHKDHRKIAMRFAGVMEKLAAL